MNTMCARGPRRSTQTHLTVFSVLRDQQPDGEGASKGTQSPAAYLLYLHLLPAVAVVFNDSPALHCLPREDAGGGGGGGGGGGRSVL